MHSHESWDKIRGGYFTGGVDCRVYSKPARDCMRLLRNLLIGAGGSEGTACRHLRVSTEEAMNRIGCKRRLGVLTVMGVLGCSSIAAADRSSNAVPMPFGQDLQGRPLQRLAPPGTRAVVLYFAATDCPISNRYLPEVARLHDLFRAQGVEVFSVYPNPGDTRALVATHDRQFGAAGETLLDPQQRLVHMAHARQTPEAALLVPDGAGWREVYLGRIDDRYLSLGQERPSATRHDLEDAIQAALAHRPVPQPGGPSVGCAIISLPR